MFVAVITTGKHVVTPQARARARARAHTHINSSYAAIAFAVFMDVRSSNTPSDGMGGGRESLAEKQSRLAAELQSKRESWTKPCYHVRAMGGEGPFVEPQKDDPKERIGLIWHPFFDRERVLSTPKCLPRASHCCCEMLRIHSRLHIYQHHCSGCRSP
eukprot:COSAG05_NODE_412_length_10089_cov_13.887287_4_plen_158_part_00